MEGKTRSSKRKGVVDLAKPVSLSTKRGKIAPPAEDHRLEVVTQPLPRLPFKNKNQKNSSRIRNESSGKRSSSGGPKGSLNNNAQPADKPMEQADEEITFNFNDSRGQVDPDDTDHIRVNVRESEDEFADEETREIPYNEASDLESEANSLDSEASEVVFSEATAKLMKEQEAAHVNKIANHPDMQECVKSMVGQQLKLALSDPAIAARNLAEMPGTTGTTAAGNKCNFTKRTIHNPKSPSDTTLYAPALNLTPDRNNRYHNNPSIISGTPERNGPDMAQALQVQPSTNVVPSIVGQPTVDEPWPSTSRQGADPEDNAAQGWIEQAQENAKRMVADAEHNKAQVDVPQGNPSKSYLDTVDDEFFHITCHVEDSLKEKIEAGKFVKLEKLLIKD